MIKFDKNIKFGGQGCPPYGAQKIRCKNLLTKLKRQWRKSMSLQNKIQNLLQNRNLLKPKVVTNPYLQDIEIENDLQGKDLFELEKDKIKILSADLQIFNDEAFRYYLPQFVYFYLISL